MKQRPLTLSSWRTILGSGLHESKQTRYPNATEHAPRLRVSSKILVYEGYCLAWFYYPYPPPVNQQHGRCGHESASNVLAAT